MCSRWLGNAPIHSAILLPCASTSSLQKGDLSRCHQWSRPVSLRVPVYIHESDLSMGLANKIAYKLLYQDVRLWSKHMVWQRVRISVAVTKVTDHIPTTSEVLEEKIKGFRKDLPTLLFVGGSAGARVFNEFVTEHQAELLHHYNIINLTGDSTLNQGWGWLVSSGLCNWSVFAHAPEGWFSGD